MTVLPPLAEGRDNSHKAFNTEPGTHWALGTLPKALSNPHFHSSPPGSSFCCLAPMPPVIMMECLLSSLYGEG